MSHTKGVHSNPRLLTRIMTTSRSMCPARFLPLLLVSNTIVHPLRRCMTSPLPNSMAAQFVETAKNLVTPLTNPLKPSKHKCIGRLYR